MTKPHFIVKRNLQKSNQTGQYFSDVITESVMKDVCLRITGLSEFTYQYVDNDYQDDFLEKGYNKGRMAILLYHDDVFYISFSEKEIGGRNSSVQSVPTAFNLFYLNPYPRKQLFYYFLNADGNVGTDYQMLFYRLMQTIGFVFLNANDALQQNIISFTSIEDVMHIRKSNASRNHSNNSTYITKSSIYQYDIYGKTYGANKYETSMMCYALSRLAQPYDRLSLYEVLEGDLRELPDSSLSVLKHMGNIQIIPTDIQLEKNAYDANNSLRSPRYIFNLLAKLGEKHCALCDCEIPELIQGAHILPVAEIKRNNSLNIDQKLTYATDGENGLWLCENHHKLFDEGYITLNNYGMVVPRPGVNQRDLNYMSNITTNVQIPPEYLTQGFLFYLSCRNTIAI